jgi:ABC-type Na+ transport system ATPase subunit NatA
LRTKVEKGSALEIKQRVAQVAEILGLGELLQRKRGQLSGGQRQRVAVGRALVRQAQTGEVHPTVKGRVCLVENLGMHNLVSVSVEASQSNNSPVGKKLPLSLV